MRGVRIYADGIPGTMPDGQGQFSHFDLGSADHLEVLRGPFSALYGNSSGGVIALFTEDGKPGSTLQGSAALGSFATRRYALKDSGDTGGVNYLIDAAHFATQGYRDHSAAERNNLNAKLRIALNGGAKLPLVANALETPFVQNPLGLSSLQLASDPSQVGNALLYDTRKGVGQEQLGATYEQSVAEHDAVAVSVYAGRRATTQYQAILRSVELASLKNPGGVIDLVRRARIYADDRNTAAAGGFWVANLRAGLEQRTGNWRIREAFSVENIANRTYVGSVIVNEGNSRFFEPAPGRVAYIMFNAAHRN